MNAEESFYREFTGLLGRIRPEQSLDALTPETHLWRNGYIDSISMLEIVVFLEDLTGREIELDSEFMSKFVTMKSIFENFAASAAEPAAGG